MRTVPRHVQMRCAHCHRIFDWSATPDPTSVNRVYCCAKHRNAYLAGHTYHSAFDGWVFVLYFFVAAGVFILVLWTLLHPARGAPPEGVDPTSEEAQYFQSLKQPDTGVGCCSQADCHYWNGEWKLEGYHYWVLVDSGWQQVPDNKIIEPNTSPRGFAVLCFTESHEVDQNGTPLISVHILCWSPGTEA